MNNFKAILWGLLQAVVVIFVCSMTIVVANQLQNLETYPGFLEDLAFLLLFGVGALVSGTVVLARPVYLMLQQQIKGGFMILLSTIVWLALITISAIIVIVFFDVHAIF